MRFSKRTPNKLSFKKEKGSALTEYTVVLVFMSVLIYLAIIEGITFETVDANGIPVIQTIPALSQVLANEEENFINALVLP